MMYGALLLVALHGATQAVAQPLLEDPSPKTGGFYAGLAVKALIGVIMGCGIFLGMVELSFALAQHIFYV